MTETEYIAATVRLLAASETHRRAVSIADYERLYVPPLRLGQFAFWLEAGAPVAVATWAWLGETEAKGFADRTRLLMPDDWRSGSEPWIIDFIAPYGHARDLVKVLRRHFRGHVVKSTRTRRDNRIHRWSGYA